MLFVFGSTPRSISDYAELHGNNVGPRLGSRAYVPVSTRTRTPDDSEGLTRRSINASPGYTIISHVLLPYTGRSFTALWNTPRVAKSGHGKGIHALLHADPEFEGGVLTTDNCH